MRLLLLGKDFTLITDNRAIELIFRNPKSKPPARIERWNLRLSDFRFKIVHKPGKYNLADYLSKHPVEKGVADKESEEFIALVTEHAIPKATSKDDLLKALEEDETLMNLRRAIIERDTKDPKLARYRQVWHELSVTNDGLVLRGRLIVIPCGLRKRAIQIAHEGHLGIAKTKSLMRTKSWFPDMDRMIEDAIGRCTA